MKYATVSPPKQKPPMQEYLILCEDIVSVMKVQGLLNYTVGILCPVADDSVPKYCKYKLSEFGFNMSYEPDFVEEIITKYTYDFLGNPNGVYQVVDKKFIGYKITVTR